MELDNNFKPYLIRAFYDWCNDNLLTPYLRVYVNKFTQVPNQYVIKDEIVLNINSTATKDLDIGNKFIKFYARFSGIEQKILIPIGHIISFYAKETGQGMNFEVEIYNSQDAQKDLSVSNNTGEDLSIHDNKKSYLKIIKNKLR